MTKEERKRAWIREYRRKRRAAGKDSMGNEHRDTLTVRRVLSEWKVDQHGNLSRELRGI